MRESTALLISGDSSLIESVRGVVEAIPHLRLHTSPSFQEASTCLRHKDVTIALAHLVETRHGEEGRRLLQKIAATKRPVATLVISEQHQGEEALALLRLGAADNLCRPLDLNRLAFLVDILTVRTRFSRTLPPPAPEPIGRASTQEPFFYLGSSMMEQLMEQIRRVAPQETTLLLNGETGTGKTRLARLIHEQSPRRTEPFIVISCGTMAPNLIESEMFGHLKGSFTGADRDRTGKFAEVGRGTLLLDEIDALSLPLQAKLLRAVEERFFEPVGSNKSLPMQGRLIAACNQPLETKVASGQFRSDLYYRLNVVGFHLPPLRERRAVIQPIVAHFIDDFAARNGRPMQGIATEALRTLEAYDWPGNIRELRNVIERAVALCPGVEIQLSDLPEPLCAAAAHGRRSRSSLEDPDILSPSSLGQVRGNAEVACITEALQKHRNNRLHAAAALGISRMTLYKKMHKYGLIDAGRGVASQADPEPHEFSR